MREVRIAATPEAVWRAWTDPAGLAEWFVDRATGAPEVGTVMTWHWDTFGAAGEVMVRAADAPRDLVLETSTARMLEIRIRAMAGGETLLRLVESGFHGSDPASLEEKEGVASGWTLALTILRLALECYPRQPRREVLVMQPARFDDGALATLCRTRSGLAHWLLPAFEGQAEFDGDLLASTAREALWSWPALHGALELKAFTGPAGRTLAVRASQWGSGNDVLASLKPGLARALERLAARVAR